MITDVEDGSLFPSCLVTCLLLCLVLRLCFIFGFDMCALFE